MNQHEARKVVARGAGARVAQRYTGEDSTSAEVDRAAAARGLVIVWHPKRGCYVLAKDGGRVARRYSEY